MRLACQFDISLRLIHIARCCRLTEPDVLRFAISLLTTAALQQEIAVFLKRGRVVREKTTTCHSSCQVLESTQPSLLEIKDDKNSRDMDGLLDDVRNVMGFSLVRFQCSIPVPRALSADTVSLGRL